MAIQESITAPATAAPIIIPRGPPAIPKAAPTRIARATRATFLIDKSFFEMPGISIGSPKDLYIIGLVIIN
jgi:hypothetical protein